MIEKIINNNSVIAEIRVSTATPTDRGIVCNYLETTSTGKNLHKILTHIITGYEKKFKIGGNINIDFLVLDDEVKILIYLASDNQTDLFECEVIELQKLINKTISDASKIYKYHSEIIDKGEKPIINISSNNQYDNSVIFDGHQTMNVSNQSAFDLAETLGRCKADFDFSENIIKIGNESLSFPKTDKKITVQKIIDKTNLLKYRIEVMSVNSHNDNFRFRRSQDNKILTGKYRGIEMRKELLLCQINEKTIYTELHQIVKGGLTQEPTDEFELINICD